jgi:tripartite-type tricarboxylate transporter receptor subunit TctC
MNTIRRRTLLIGAALLASPSRAQSQSWPDGRIIRILVPFPPGGSTDVLARLLAERLGQKWGTNLVVENRPGAAGNVGTAEAARSEPDGRTTLISSIGMATNRFLYSTVTYDPLADFAPISLLAVIPNVLVVGQHVPVQSLSDFIEYAKANPGRLTYGSSGIGSAPHLSGELFDRMTGIKTVHVPYRGTAIAMQDILGGRIDFMFDNLTPALPHIRSGAVKAFGITTRHRSPAAPELAPINDTVPGYDTYTWFGMFMPAKTPAEIVEKLYRDVREVLHEPLFRERLAVLGAEPVGSTPTELTAFLKSEIDKWGAIIREANIKSQ